MAMLNGTIFFPKRDNRNGRKKTNYKIILNRIYECAWLGWKLRLLETIYNNLDLAGVDLDEFQDPIASALFYHYFQVCQLSKFEWGGGLGVSLEGTVDVEGGREVRPPMLLIYIYIYLSPLHACHLYTYITCTPIPPVSMCISYVHRSTYITS